MVVCEICLYGGRREYKSDSRTPIYHWHFLRVYGFQVGRKFGVHRFVISVEPHSPRECLQEPLGKAPLCFPANIFFRVERGQASSSIICGIADPYTHHPLVMGHQFNMMLEQLPIGANA